MNCIYYCVITKQFDVYKPGAYGHNDAKQSDLCLFFIFFHSGRLLEFAGDADHAARQRGHRLLLQSLAQVQLHAYVHRGRRRKLSGGHAHPVRSSSSERSSVEQWRRRRREQLSHGQRAFAQRRRLARRELDRVSGRRHERGHIQRRRRRQPLVLVLDFVVLASPSPSPSTTPSAPLSTTTAATLLSLVVQQFAQHSRQSQPTTTIPTDDTSHNKDLIVNARLVLDASDRNRHHVGKQQQQQQQPQRQHNWFAPSSIGGR